MITNRGFSTPHQNPLFELSAPQEGLGRSKTAPQPSDPKWPDLPSPGYIWVYWGDWYLHLGWISSMEITVSNRNLPELHTKLLERGFAGGSIEKVKCLTKTPSKKISKYLLDETSSQDRLQDV
jgi:hypothetical protein